MQQRLTITAAESGQLQDRLKKSYATCITNRDNRRHNKTPAEELQKYNN